MGINIVGPVHKWSQCTWPIWQSSRSVICYGTLEQPGREAAMQQMGRPSREWKEMQHIFTAKITVTVQQCCTNSKPTVTCCWAWKYENVSVLWHDVILTNTQYNERSGVRLTPVPLEYPLVIIGWALRVWSHHLKVILHVAPCAGLVYAWSVAVWLRIASPVADGRCAWEIEDVEALELWHLETKAPVDAVDAV